MLAFICLIASLLPPYRAVSGPSPQKIQAKHAQVELLSRQTVAIPGQPLQVGVHFVLEPGWHIYWLNPGDSGQPPVLEWQLPTGSTAGEIQWPRPERMQNTPSLADYGYHNDVLLIVPLHVSSTAGTSLPITLDAHWLICREVCLPDRAQMRLSITVGPQAKENSAAAGLFAATEKLVPKPLPQRWRAVAHQDKENFVLSLDTGKRVDKAEFFPLDADQIDNAATPNVKPSTRGVEITLKRSDQLLKPISVLRGVIVLAGGDAYRVDAPVQPKVIK